MYLPSHVEGPTNGVKAPEHFGDFMDKYYRRLHIIEVDSLLCSSLVPMMASGTSKRDA